MSGVISMLTNWMGKGSRRGCAGRYVKGHEVLRLARPAPENSGGGQQGGAAKESVARKST